LAGRSTLQALKFHLEASANRDCQKSLESLKRKSNLSEERQLEALRLLEANPRMTQRELAAALGVSLGATNYCLKALVEKGWLKLENFQRNPNKLGYLYLLTPIGIAAKAQLATRFLRRKLIEYETLKAEIEALQSDVEDLTRQS
jgi:EPS-associated MarR family transcriptional regulator